MPPFFSELIYKYLDNALDYGILEFDFWEMTLAEIDRAIESKIRVMKVEEKQRATYTYILADLIGYSVGRIHNSNNKMPSISEVFPDLFVEDKEQIEENKIKKFKAELLRFTQSHNDRLKGVNQ